MRNYGRNVVIAGCLLINPLAEVSGQTPAKTPRQPSQESRQSVIGTMAVKVIELTNAERAKKGLSPLNLQESLMTAAQAHAQDMAEKGYFDHKDKQRREPWERATAHGYEWSRIGENIALGSKTPESVVRGWMNSPGHRQNILGDFKEIGAGVARGGKNGRTLYWVQVFGSPR